MFGDATCETLHERLDEPVKLVGLVSSIKKNQIKKGQNEGKTMAKAVVEDLTGTVAVTVFASLLERINGWFAPGKAILVTGTVRSSMQIGGGAASGEHEGESSSMPIEVIAREIQQLEGMKEQSARHVVVAPSNFDTFDEKSLGEILRRFPGSTPVFLEMRRAGQFAAPLKLSPEFWVRPTPEFTTSMETLLGPGSVRYGYAPSA
jgi:DNA polymerase III alpha subunit